MPETIMDQIGADGTFTEGFAGAIKTALGDGYADSKYFDDIHDLTALAKRGVDTRAKNTELSGQLKEIGRLCLVLLHEPANQAPPLVVGKQFIEHREGA